MTTSDLAAHRQQILDLARRHGVRDVRVFGSMARGEPRAASDVDLLVSLERGRSLIDLVALKQELEDLLHCEVDLVTEGSLSPYLQEQVLAEAVHL